MRPALPMAIAPAPRGLGGGGRARGGAPGGSRLGAALRPRARLLAAQRAQLPAGVLGGQLVLAERGEQQRHRRSDTSRVSAIERGRLEVLANTRGCT